MMNSDEAIERILAALRDTEAPAGMERRILESIRDVVPRRSGWRPMMPSWLVGMRTWAIAVAGVAVVSSIVCWTAFREYRPGHDSIGSKSQIVPANLTAPEVRVAAANAQTRLPGSPVVRGRGKTNTRRAAFVREDEPTAAQHEMRAANHPAPEAPLTEEEKLLLRIAHRGDPAEMAMLNPLLWSVRDAEEKAEVQRFFESSTTGDDR
jgi:hypothetical protein